jgi:site-specific DNA-methyltransferase (adenine-specific)
MIPDNSVDAVVTDPPYELGFMGKKWDKTGIANNVDMWHEVLRVLKPGGHLLAFGGTRTYHRMACAIEDAGFEIRDQLQWIYGSGFTKSMDISKAIYKKAGIWRGKAGNVISKNGSMSAPNYERTPKVEPITELAKQWNGFGTALKPANEPICLARKPLTKKSVVDNILRYGTGGINIDGCRIPTTQLHVQKAKGSNGTQGIYGDFNTMGVYAPNPHGRFPSNVILDENASQLLDAQTGTLKSRFFYCAKASRKERDQGLDDHNNHPTVKPVDLMRYLVSLVTKEGQVVLDPFMGSGTTGVACVLNHRDFIGIDKDKHYCDIAERRIAYSI